MTGSDEAIQMVPKIAKWQRHHKRLGGKIKRGGPASSNSHSKKKTDYKLLADNAIAMGWLNGVKIKGHR